jgi:lipopolysaccharide export system protein LptA
MRTLLPIFFVISLLLVPQARAQDLEAGPSVPDMIDIESDRLEVDTQKGEAVFTGNVRANQGDIVIHGQRLTLTFGGAEQKIDTLTAEQNVLIRWQDREATCEKAVFNPGDETLDLTGDVVVTRGVERLSGERVTVDMKTDRQMVEGKGGRVRIRVHNDQDSGILKWQK